MNGDPHIPDGSRAILIGVPHYQDPKYLSYTAVGNSVDGMYHLLVESGLCGWRSDQVTRIVNPTNDGQLLGRLRRLAAETTGVLLLYFVGHGEPSEHTGELCLAITDTDHANPDTTGLEYSKIRRMLHSGTPATTRIAILDCCYAGIILGQLGAADDGGTQLAQLSNSAGAYTLTAADGPAHVPPDKSWARESWADNQGIPRTAFTGELLALLTFDGIPGGPPSLSLGAIYPHLRRRLEAKGLPRPNQRNDDCAAAFVFARNATPPGEHRRSQPPRPTEPRLVHPDVLRQSSRQRAFVRSIAITFLAIAIVVVIGNSLWSSRSPADNILAPAVLFVTGIMALGANSNTQLILTQDGVRIRWGKSTFIRWSEIKAVLVEDTENHGRRVRFVLSNKSMISPVPMDSRVLGDREFDQKVSIIQKWHDRFGSPEPWPPGGRS
ncbi:caspase family protein [Actinocrispum wychmicini]|uniref:Caspase domain-containing protein n=1 Tax=Actinocrispum wychmicini TaxID=1213861 RepID=A0A4R2K380_9PSEU|nr:caspase family protein [Actinocrispum wychmicini]TCO60755.1 caspase domain-containing protein [Actinocrispum wychmicini]